MRRVGESTGKTQSGACSLPIKVPLRRIIPDQNMRVEHPTATIENALPRKMLKVNELLTRSGDKTTADKFGKSKTVDKFEYNETVDKFHSQRQATICVCSEHNSVRYRMCAMSMTPCVIC